MIKNCVIDDLIILGRACPEHIKDGRTTVCTAGYSDKLGFVRVYPTTLRMPWKTWDIVKVPVERNPRDNREESWKIQGSKSEWEKLHTKIEIVGNLKKRDRGQLISNLVDGCIVDINNNRGSLGIIKPTIKQCFFAEQKNYDKTIQTDLLGFKLPKVKGQYSIQPRIKYRCSNCKSKKDHDQQVLEWGFYEWFRKNPDNPDQVWKNARMDSNKSEKYFFVGNHFRHRKSFFIISILRIPKEPKYKPLIPLDLKK